MERGLRTTHTVLATTLALGMLPASAFAQVSSVFLDRWNLGFSLSRTSARLDAMAGTWVALEDESREINIWDYGGNVAGFLDDRDAWTGDFWARSRDVNRRNGVVGSSGEVVESGMQLSFRSFERALGLEGSLTVGADEGSGGERHKFSGPDVSVIGNHAIGASFVFGAGLRIVNEEEKTTSSDPLSIEHGTARTDVSVGLVYFLGERLDVGVSTTFTRNRIEGVSEDGLHRDVYDWDRPSNEIGAQVIYGAEGPIQGGAFVRYGRLDGGEVLEISWSREFFLNPSGVDLGIDVPLVDERLEETEFGTRWLLEVSEIIDIGAALSALSGTYDARVNPTFPGISASADEEFTETTLSAGVALHPIGAVALAGQIDVGKRELDAIVFDALERVVDDLSAVGVGLEYFWRPTVALRGGVRLGKRKRETTLEGEVERLDFDEREISAGLGWSPNGGVFIFDLAMGFVDGEATEPASARDETKGVSFTLTGRTLFR